MDLSERCEIFSNPTKAALKNSVGNFLELGVGAKIKVKRATTQGFRKYLRVFPHEVLALFVGFVWQLFGLKIVFDIWRYV